MADKTVADLVRLFHPAGIDIAIKRDCQRLEVEFLQGWFETFAGGCHQRRMEGGGHRQRQHTPRTGFRQPLASTGHRRCRARNHDLSRRIEVDGSDGPASRRLFLFAGSLHLFVVEADHRRHCPFADRDGLLHEATTHPDRAGCVRHIQSTGCNHGRILTEAVSGYRTDLKTSVGQYRPGCNRMREQRRLRVLGQPELVLGTVPAQLGEVRIEAAVDRLKDSRR